MMVGKSADWTVEQMAAETVVCSVVRLVGLWAGKLGGRWVGWMVVPMVELRVG